MCGMYFERKQIHLNLWEERDPMNDAKLVREEKYPK